MTPRAVGVGLVVAVYLAAVVFCFMAGRASVGLW